MQFNACSEKGIAILSNSIARDHSFRHTTSDLYRQSGLHENKGRTLLQNIQVTQGYHEWLLYRTSSTLRTMYNFQNRENPMIARKVRWQWILYWFSNPWHSTYRCWTSLKKFGNWLGNSKITQTGICCSRFLRNRRRSNTSVENPRIWLLEWVITKSSNVTRLLLRYNALVAPNIGKLVSYTAHAANACSLRRWIDNTTKTDLTHCRFLDTW